MILQPSPVLRKLRACCVGGLLVWGGTTLAVGATPVQQQTIQTPQRLSAWLNQHRDELAGADVLGLMWLVESERAAQAQARERLLVRLADVARERRRSGLATPGIDRLIAQVEAGEATGRVLTAALDARWLEANPARDPVLQPGDRLRWAGRPGTVQVLADDGRRCVLAQRAAARVHELVDACLDAQSARPDRVWVIQPDGRVQRHGVAAWNTEPPLQLAPGALVWIPPAGIDAALAADVASWLAWAGPQADPAADASDTVWRQVEASDEQLAARRQAQDLAVRNPPTLSDWGFTGLLQTPTARMQPEGALSLSLQRTWPYTRTNVFLQPLEDLEIGFRYTAVANRLYGAVNFSGQQSYKDKSIDAKLRLLREGAWSPELSVGILDMGGTGLFGSEYLVANKRWGGLDFSLGLGWGYLGQRRDLRNPLSAVSARFDDRPGASTLTGQGGTIGWSRFFRGPVGVFGGVQFRPSSWPLLVKLELDGNDYQSEPQANRQPQKSPLNLGLVYQLNPTVDLSLGLQRGNRLAFGLAFHVPMADLNTPKLLDPRPIGVSPLRPVQAPALATTLDELSLQTGWAPRGVTRASSTVVAEFADVDSPYLRDRLDKSLQVLHRDAPAEVERLQVRFDVLGRPALLAEVDRQPWMAGQTEAPRSNTVVDAVQLRRLDADAVLPAAPAPLAEAQRDQKPLSLRPSIDLHQTIGGPNGFVLFDVSASLRGRLSLPADWRVDGEARLRLIDNYGGFTFDGSSQLPRVRTDMRSYLVTSRVTLERLALSQARVLTGNQYYAVYGGYFESMFGGVGGEWLYRRNGSRWAFGIDANRVRQRDFHQDLRWRDYTVSTGHATLYWDTGWQGISTRLNVGQYLAGDRGATLTLQKTFDNGTTMAVFATKTNVSAAQFGEGSFDKGISLSIPFDTFLPRSSNATGHFLWRPLTRDGGAMLGRPVELHRETRLLDPRTLEQRVAPLPNHLLPVDDQRPTGQASR
ncbi:protein of unknown function DUF940 membrane lipoprotein putative [Leptothrix cholodnii SP-6]|uniref:Capsule biosynthesis GfcC-like C-terminal domain-containing protein n=1 Tax=Leptothrix cholodnii (strain ATCC 51168 / LMG 8142 / SP-6) TaxID=395495 RepID=B1Y1R7_LEPCP|nr:YjbH domain-containing protein [Leptothrix cholodnii]ACB35529.1 protein of unknown function DUF940 membrane lipoprotein putative [Leptothrix cholodnii SP-6]